MLCGRVVLIIWNNLSGIILVIVTILLLLNLLLSNPATVVTRQKSQIDTAKAKNGSFLHMQKNDSSQFKLIGHKNREDAIYADVKKKQKVFLPNFQAKRHNSACLHIILDGLERSEHFELTQDVDDKDAVWVVDLVGFHCKEKLLPLMKETIERRSNSSNLISLSKNEVGVSEPPNWKVFLLDYFDSGYAWWKPCTTQLSEMLGNENVFYARRLHMKGRKIVHEGEEEETAPFHELGHRIDFIQGGDGRIFEGVVRQLRYCVRSDQAEFMQALLQDKAGANNKNIVNPVNLPRPQDVAHFWNINRQIMSHRDVISLALLELGTKTNVTVFAGVKGHLGPAGRQHAQEAYLEGLLEYKIVVVCQRDNWEGHWRLMEALLGGAMVMTDPMHPLPYLYEDGESLVVYRSVADLKEKILYFLDHTKKRLEIARRGHEIAMSHHRSWHIMERIILGNWSDIYV